MKKNIIIPLTILLLPAALIAGTNFGLIKATKKRVDKLDAKVVAAIEKKAATSPRAFTSNGSFIAPAGITLITVAVWGGGGGGNIYSGGGGGGYAQKNTFSVSSGTVYTVTVGTGGLGSGPAGGTSSFSLGGSVLVSATGGGVGTSLLVNGYGAGGTGTGGVISLGINGVLSPASSFCDSSECHHGHCNCGQGGAGGNGGAGGYSGSVRLDGHNGTNGKAPGGGGGEAPSGYLPGSGAPGQVIVSW